MLNPGQVVTQAHQNTSHLAMQASFLCQELSSLLETLKETKYIEEQLLFTMERVKAKMLKPFSTAEDFFEVSTTLSMITGEEQRCLNDNASELLRKIWNNLKLSFEQKIVNFILEINNQLEDNRIALVAARLFAGNLDSEKINKRYKDLARIFHPDKITPNEATELITNFFKRLTDVKSFALTRACTLIKTSLNEHEKMGDDFLKQAKETRTSNPSDTQGSNHAELAFNEYLQACQAFDADKDVSSQIRIRTKLSETLLVSRKTLGAQIYVLGALRIFFDSDNQPESLFYDLCGLLRKTKTPDSAVDFYLLKAIDNHPDISFRLAPYGSINGSSQRSNLVGEDMSKLIKLKPRENVREPDEYLISRINVTSKVAHKSPDNSIRTSTVMMLSSFATRLGFGKNRKIIQNFQERLSNAIAIYREGKYQAFLNELGKQYPDHPGIFSIYVENSKIEIYPIDLVSTLLDKYNLEPESAAQLLNLIGNALLCPTLKFSDTYSFYIQLYAAHIFHYLIENKSLIHKAKDRDEQVSPLRMGLTNSLEQVKEVQFVATINLVLNQLILGRSDNLKFAMQRLLSAKNEIQANPHCALIAPNRIALVEHFLFAEGIIPSPHFPKVPTLKPAQQRSTVNVIPEVVTGGARNTMPSVHGFGESSNTRTKKA